MSTVKRVPSIHTTEKELADFLEFIFEDTDVVRNWKNIAKDFNLHVKNKKLNHRSIIITNDRLEKKANILLKASSSDTSLLAMLLFHMRRKTKALYTSKKIDKDSKDYTQLKELTKICVEFCNQFELDKKKGFTKYLEIALPKISSSLNYINKLINLNDKVIQIYESTLRIQDDVNVKLTREIHDKYVTLISNITGIRVPYDKDPTVYVGFISVSELLKEIKVDVDTYLKAQFEGLSWTDSYPLPQQLIGDNAMSRLNKFIYSNKSKNKDTLSTSDSVKEDELTKKLLKLKNKHNGKNRDN